MKQDFEDELDVIRVKLYENTKGKSNAYVANQTNAVGKRIAEKYGITVVKGETIQAAPQFPIAG
ncbi:MAG: hypothetical protein LBS96_00015 [Oscillospiraceae bacterium]|jgi:hypothetical protein|nr:hypothetical protein [Oscillospiraceae bacterium]